MAKNIEADAPAAETTAPVVTTVVQRPRTGLLVGGIVGGAVVLGGLLFGGGVLVGVSLPIGHGGPAMSQFAEGAPDRGELREGPGQLPQFGGGQQQGGGQQGPGQQGPRQQGGDRQLPPMPPQQDGDADNG